MFAEVMKASELRIGNWVKSLTHGIEYKIDFIFESPMMNEIQPIPLTEEWLLKFGFKKEGQLYVKDFFGDYIGVDADDFSVGTYAFGRIAHAPQPTLMNVHQLQNLYFALTGEELTIKQQ